MCTVAMELKKKKKSLPPLLHGSFWCFGGAKIAYSYLAPERKKKKNYRYLSDIVLIMIVKSNTIVFRGKNISTQIYLIHVEFVEWGLS